MSINPNLRRIDTIFGAVTQCMVLLTALLQLSNLGASAAEPNDARSVHLWWHPNPTATDFYNEIKVERSTGGSYFCVCGFSHGYFGLQQSNEGNKVVIFSVWDPSNPQDLAARATDVPADKHVQVVYCDAAVTTKRFGGEGTGQQSFYQFPWEIGRTYKFLVKAKTANDRTAYAAFVFDPRFNQWKHLATFATKANGDLLQGFYSFDEDFRRDGNSAQEERSAYFSNGWLRTADGRWQRLDSATFTATSNPLTNIDAWVDGAGFGLATGGQIQNRHARVNDKLNATSQSFSGQPQVESLK